MAMAVKTTMVAAAVITAMEPAIIVATITAVITTAVVWVSEAERDDGRIVRRSI